MISKLFAAFLGVVFLLIIPLILRIKFAEHQVRKLQKEKSKAEQKRRKLYESLNLLGLPQNPTKRQIRDAHKKLMIKNHPDRGGSKFMAAKINVARDVLLDEVV